MTVDVHAVRRPDDPKDKNGPKASPKVNLSARFPRENYDDIDSLAFVTGRSISEILEDAFAAYLKHYLTSPDYFERRDEFARIVKEREDQGHRDLANGTLRRYSPARGRGHGRVGRGDGQDVRQTVVRVDAETRATMKDAATAMGISLNDVMIEALEMWLEESADDEQVFVEARNQFFRYTRCLERSLALPEDISERFRDLYEGSVEKKKSVRFTGEGRHGNARRLIAVSANSASSQP